MPRRLLAVLACLAAAPRALADVSLGIEATLGAQRVGVSRVPGTGEALVPMGDLGTAVLLRLGALAVGAAAERTGRDTDLNGTTASAMAGLATDPLPALRLELLGEVGAANLRSGADLRAAADDRWGRFYGFRPGLSAKLPMIPLRLGVWGLARWGLPGAARGPALGLLGRVGVEF